jgi:hypothetical protein
MRSDLELDDAIDRAVRDIMSAEPRAGFQNRVLARLDDAVPSGQRASWFTLPRFAAAMSVLVVAIAVAALLRTNEAQAPAPAPVVAQAQPPAPQQVRPVAQAPAALPEPTTEPAQRRDGPRVKFPPKGVVAAASVTDPEATTPAAQPDPAAAAAGSELLIIAPVPLAIAPLIIQPIVIPPIRPPR